MPTRLTRIGFVSPSWPAGTQHNGVITYVDNIRRGLAEIGVPSCVVAGSVTGLDVGDDVIDARDAASLTERVKLAVLDRVAPAKAARARVVANIVAAANTMQARASYQLFEMEESFGYAREIQRGLRVPMVVRLHGPWFLNGTANGVAHDDAYRERNENERAAVAQAAGVSSPSRDVLARVRREFRLELAEAEVVPNPCPAVAPERRWTLAHCDRNELLFVGRFDRHKGGDLMIDAFALLAPRYPALTLSFAGPDRGCTDERGRAYRLPEYIEHRIADAAVRRRINVLGPCPSDRVQGLRRRAFVTVVPSRYETFSMTAVEAISFGSPLVAAATGGIPEVVSDEHAALLFAPGDAQALADRIAVLLDNPAHAERLSESALAHFEAHFTPASVATKMRDFYERVLSRA